MTNLRKIIYCIFLVLFYAYIYSFLYMGLVSCRRRHCCIDSFVYSTISMIIFYRSLVTSLNIKSPDCFCSLSDSDERECKQQHEKKKMGVHDVRLP